MKILLIGDFSSAHYNLKQALELNGHEVTLYSNGDKYKQIPTDKKFYIRKENEHFIFGSFKEILSQSKVLKEIKRFDIIQVISHRVFHNRINRLFLDFILNSGKPVVMFNAACNHYYNAFVTELEYSPCSSCKKYDIKTNVCIHETKKEISYEKRFYNKFKAIVSAHYEYYQGFENSEFRDKNYFIPIPVFKDHNVKILTPKDKVNVYFGQTRRGFKGVDVILDAIKEIQESKYGKFFNFQIHKKLPYHKHVEVLNNSDILIDQVNSYSYGVNALVGLSKGKIIMSGMENETMEWMGVQKDENPIINIKPNKNDIIGKLTMLYENRNCFPEYSKKSIEFIEKFHSPQSIANKYINLYKKLL